MKHSEEQNTKIPLWRLPDEETERIYRNAPEMLKRLMWVAEILHRASDDNPPNVNLEWACMEVLETIRAATSQPLPKWTEEVTL
jgi:hypothetical protein|tara:strand:+ start:3947 stop:4198 length:252 start_codon:yes stop_codon:yes gene_type:complete